MPELGKRSSYSFAIGTPYVITVHTGNVSSAGTDANVFITLNGEKKQIQRYALQKPEGGKGAFEKGNNVDVGQVRNIEMREDFNERGCVQLVENNCNRT
jgi:hypothetical protein